MLHGVLLNLIVFSYGIKRVAVHCAYMAETKMLSPTDKAEKDEYYADIDATCDCCSEPEPSLVGVNASMGQRKLKHLCGDCIGDMQDAPAGIYDPVVIATWNAGDV